MDTYIYKGNKLPDNSSDAIIYTGLGEDEKPQGQVRDGYGEAPVILIGEEIKLSAAERDRLAGYFYLESTKKGEIVNPDAQPPETTPDFVPESPAERPPAPSPSEGSLSEKGNNSSSSSSKK